MAEALLGQPQVMLHITPEAGLTIQKLTHAQGVAAGGGLRVEARAGEQGFALTAQGTASE